MNFRTGVLVITPDDVEVVEYNRWRVAVSYVKSWFVIDVVSGVPFAAIELILNGGGSGGESGAGALKNAKLLKLLRFLKLGRLLKVEKILGNLNRDTLDRIEDFLQVRGNNVNRHFHFSKLVALFHSQDFCLRRMAELDLLSAF
jgi:hypothetical protein